MSLLLDTCTFLWLTLDDPSLSPAARRLFTNPEVQVFLSVVSAWEIAVKHASGRLALPEAPDRFVPKYRSRHGVETLALDEDSVLHVARLPAVHRDPFDRMLVCQALAHGLTIVTPDPEIGRYPVRTAW